MLNSVIPKGLRSQCNTSWLQYWQHFGQLQTHHTNAASFIRMLHKGAIDMHTKAITAAEHTLQSKSVFIKVEFPPLLRDHPHFLPHHAFLSTVVWVQKLAKYFRKKTQNRHQFNSIRFGWFWTFSYLSWNCSKGENEIVYTGCKSKRL